MRVSRSALAGVPEKIFSPGQESAVGSHGNKCNLEKITRAKKNWVMLVKFNNASLF
jgi:hypothetical protein